MIGVVISVNRFALSSEAAEWYELEMKLLSTERSYMQAILNISTSPK